MLRLKKGLDSSAAFLTSWDSGRIPDATNLRIAIHSELWSPPASTPFPPPPPDAQLRHHTPCLLTQWRANPLSSLPHCLCATMTEDFTDNSPYCPRDPPALLLFWSILTKKNPLWSVFAACCNLKREEWERVEVGGGLGPTSWCHGCSRVTLSWDLHMCSQHWPPDCWHANNMQFIVYISFSLCKSTSLDTW